MPTAAEPRGPSAYMRPLPPESSLMEPRLRETEGAVLWPADRKREGVMLWHTGVAAGVAAGVAVGIGVLGACQGAGS